MSHSAFTAASNTADSGANEGRIAQAVLEFYKELPFNYHGSPAAQANMIRAQDSVMAYPILKPLLRPGIPVLEIGCGAGWLALSLRIHHQCDVTAIDFNPIAIARAIEVTQLLRQNVRFKVADLFSYQPDEPAELVISLGVLHHTADCLGALERLFDRFVRPEGHAFIGLYHSFGRHPFLQHFADLKASGASEDAMLAEYRRLHHRLTDDTFARSWFRDQVLHPHETQHSLAELFPLFDRCGMQLRATSINDFGTIEPRERLCALEREYERRAREELRKGEYFPGFFLCLLQKTAA